MVLHHEIAGDGAAAVPRWERAASIMLAWASRQVLVLSHCTPVNLRQELEALQADFQAGRERAPAFEYAAPPAPPAPAALEDELLRCADTLSTDLPLGALYAERAREIALEARICMSAGSTRLGALARKRYGRRDRFDDLADELSRAWLDDGTTTHRDFDVSATSVSDDEHDPHSLLVCMQRAVGENRLPFRVLASSQLAALAATGPRVIYVARGQRMTHHAVERTVLHEIEGHALPRHRASSMPLGIFAFGSARGSDDQEGRAIALEHGAGLLDVDRRVELARRHLAGRSVEGGGEFVDTVKMLTHDLRAPLTDALRIAARAHRGGVGSGGLARELVYLPAYLRVRERTTTLDRVMGCGQIALDVAPTLASWV